MGAINSWNKTQHQFSILSLKTYSSNKIFLTQVFFVKNALGNINEEVKRGNFKQTNLL